MEGFQGAPFALACCNSDGQVTAVNDTFVRLFLDANGTFGINPGQLQFIDFHLIDLDAPHTHYDAKLKIDEDYVLEVALCAKKQGSCIYVHVTPIAKMDKRSIIEQRLSKLNAAISAARIGIWEFNYETCEAAFSGVFKELVGKSTSDSLSYTEFRQLVSPPDLIVMDAFFSNHVEFGLPLKFEFRVEVNDEVRWLELTGESFCNGDNQRILMGSVVDCSRQKEILNELNKSTEERKFALDAGRIGTWQAVRSDDDKWNWSWDSMANQLFQFDVSEQGQLDVWASTLHPEDRDRVIHALQACIETGEDFEQRYRVTLKSGEERYIYARGVLARNYLDEAERVDGIVIDQTETMMAQSKLKKLTEELEARVADRTKELEQAKSRAEQASKAKTDFLSMMSHELRTPMNAIIGSLDLLAETKQCAESRDLLDTAKTSANNLVIILNDILDINKIEAGKLELEQQSFSISTVIDNVIKIFLPVSDKKQVILDVREDPNIPTHLEGDAVRVRQILFNLIGNAIKFTSTSEGKTGKVVLDASLVLQEGYIYHIAFSIKDSGIGIDKATQKKLFTPFTQAERSTTRKYGGTGLGLTICGKLTDMMNGQIELQSEPGEGSEFKVTIPFWGTNATSEVGLLEQNTIADKSIALLCLNSYLNKMTTRFTQYLVAESAHCEQVDDENLVDVFSHFDIVILMVGEPELCESSLLAIYESAPDKERLIIAAERTQQSWLRRHCVGARLLPIKPITRAQFVQFIATSIAELAKDRDTLSLDLDDLGDLDELELKEDGHGHSEPERTIDLRDGILVVEDNPLNRDLMEKQLKTIGFCCDFACDGKEGLQCWQRKDYKLILTDCHMPELDGYSMTKKIRENELQCHREKVPIIAVTGAAMSGDEEYCLSVGMDDFISKPIQLSLMKNVINKWYQHD